MTRSPARSLVVAASASIVFLASCGSDETEGSVASTTVAAPDTTMPSTTTPATTTTPTTTPATTPAATTTPATPPGGDTGCAELNAFVAAEEAMFQALFSSDPEAIDLVDQAAGLIAPALATAPDTIRADLETMSIAYGELAVVLDGVDLSDPDTLAAAIESVPSIDAADAASSNLNDFAEETCGYVESGLFAEVPDPPECELLDPVVAATAAGTDIDMSDVDIGADFSLPGFALNGCAYDGGAMVLTTLSFNDLELTLQQYEQNVVNTGGTVLNDVDLGGLPDSSLVTEQVGQTSVIVFEAPMPFIVGFDGDVDPVLVVSAAEALLEDQASTP